MYICMYIKRYDVLCHTCRYRFVSFFHQRATDDNRSQGTSEAEQAASQMILDLCWEIYLDRIHQLLESNLRLVLEERILSFKLVYKKKVVCVYMSFQ